MKHWITVVLVIGILINIFLFWDTMAVYGWVVALAGWVPHLFENKGETHGNS